MSLCGFTLGCGNIRPRAKVARRKGGGGILRPMVSMISDEDASSERRGYETRCVRLTEQFNVSYTLAS